MCIFVGRVLRVAKTRILIAPTTNGGQLTVYENTVESTSKNAMILPVPTGKPIVFADMSKFNDNIWEHCELYFPQKTAMTFGGGFGMASFQSKEPLPVERVGGYSCSVVPDLEAFARISRETFTLPHNIEDILRKNYGTGFSFIVCIFDHNVAAHPIAYLSDRLPNGQCFIPTRHAHGGEEEHRPAFVIHNDIACDECGTKPIQGARWNCISCPNYDLCDACYVKRHGRVSGTHDFDHLFVHVTRSVPGPDVVGSIRRGKRERAAEDLFDHTIYLLNGVLIAGPSSYSSLESANISKPNVPFTWNRASGFAALNTLLHGALCTPEFITKVTINGDYPNGDYTCNTV